MKRRMKMSPRKAKRLFRGTANRTHKKNLANRPIMRGGIRL